jgi:hypothetical protein
MTMNANHTPGPWIVARYDYDRGVAAIETKERGVDLPDQGNWVADVCAVGADDANARLIAAAPDLLAALKAIQDDPCVAMDLRLLTQMESAIAKAEGRDA